MNTLGSEREHIERESAFVLLKNPSFLLLLIAISLILAGGSSYLVYSVPFLMRPFGLTATDAGMRMGLAFGLPPVIAARSEARRVGKALVSTCESGWQHNY